MSATEPTATGDAGEATLAKIPFSAQDDVWIASMGRLMTVAAVLSAATGVVQLVTTVLRMAGVVVSAPTAASVSAGSMVLDLSIPATLVGFGLAFVLFLAGRAFHRMATTDGSDQELLTDGLRKLRLYFLVKALLLIGFVLLACGMGLLAGMSMP